MLTKYPKSCDKYRFSVVKRLTSGIVFKVLRPNRFSSLQEFVVNDKIISGDKFLRRSLIDGAFNYIKRDFFYKNGTWRDKDVKSLIFHHKFHSSKTLVVGHSDIPTTQVDALILKKLGIPKIFAVNNRPLWNFSESLPLGITNDCDDSPIHRILGNENHFLEANSAEFQTENFNPSIYVNFTSGNNIKIRNRLLTFIQGVSPMYKVTVQTPNFTNSGRIKYLANLRSSGLVLCPEGNGVDTHRFWETIYMGGTPVVLVNPMMQTFYDNLPVIQLKSWKDLSDISFIETKWGELLEKSYNFDFLATDYWVNRFSS